MKIFVPALLVLGITLGAENAAESASDGPKYTAEGELTLPGNYREWIFLSSGLGMTYGPAAARSRQGSPLFDNVFVNPGSYREFLKTGKWANGTAFLLDIRSSKSHGSINKDGHFQKALSGLEAEVKDEHGEWKFYDFPTKNGVPKPSGKLLPATASCYACHSKNTAVENTFVQFYPVLMEVAERMGTVKKDYVR